MEEVYLFHYNETPTMKQIAIILLFIALTSCNKNHSIVPDIKEEQILLSEIWSTKFDSINSAGGLSCTPLYHNGEVLFSNEIMNALCGYDTSTGKSKIYFSNNFQCFGINKGVKIDDKFYYRMNDGTLKKIDLSIGNIETIYNSEMVFFRIKELDNKLFFCTQNGYLVKGKIYNTNSNSFETLLIDTLKSNESGILEPPRIGILNGRMVAVYNFRIGLNDTSASYSKIRIIDIDNKEELYRRTFSDSLGLPSPVGGSFIYNSMLYYIGGSTISKINIETDQSIWDYGTANYNDHFYDGFVFPYNGAIIAKYTNGGMVSIDANDGTENWRIEDDATTLTNTYYIDDHYLIYFTDRINIVDLNSGIVVLQEQLPAPPNGHNDMLQEFLYFPKSRKFFFHNYVSVKCVQLEPFK